MIKRAFDLMVGGLSLVIVAVPMAVIALLIRITMGRPVLFQQSRPGLNGRLFNLTKFRTMHELRDANGQLLPDALRVTRLGASLRRSSLDELPELLNVVKGEMSLVGPRPLLVHYLDLYSSEQARRHAVRPGITGWAQVNGRNAISWEEKFELDVWYVDNWSLRLDFKIVWMTLVQVLRREGISAEGHATMPEFMGSDGAPPPKKDSP